MLKKICALALSLALLLGCAACAEANPGYEVVYTSANPIPDIVDRVRPAVVEVLVSAESWDSVTRIASEDIIGSGSGCFIRADAEGGYILTNNHIVESGELYSIL